MKYLPLIIAGIRLATWAIRSLEDGKITEEEYKELEKVLSGLFTII